ncbi:MAG: hypothetical protein M3167_00295 [Acidobacteriota bacterium]|nr:hypothetical protein [Acidobacteriota bacterium]
MTITKIKLPAATARQPLAHPHFQTLTLGAWDHTSLATQITNHHLTKILNTSNDPATRAHAAWELLTITIETTELLGSMLLNHDQPTKTAFHQTTNTQLTDLFATIASTPPNDQTLTSFLKLLPENIPATTYERILSNARTTLQTLAQFWKARIEDVRSFRHYPGHLELNDVLALEPGPHPQRDAIIAEINNLPEVLDAHALPDGNTFEYTVLTRTQALEAASLTSIAIQLILTRSSNTLLNPASTNDEERLPKLYPVLLTGLKPQERDALRRTHHLG